MCLQITWKIVRALEFLLKQIASENPYAKFDINSNVFPYAKFDINSKVQTLYILKYIIEKSKCF